MADALEVCGMRLHCATRGGPIATGILVIGLRKRTLCRSFIQERGNPFSGDGYDSFLEKSEKNFARLPLLGSNLRASDKSPSGGTFPGNIPISPFPVIHFFPSVCLVRRCSIPERERAFA